MMKVIYHSAGFMFRLPLRTVDPENYLQYQIQSISKTYAEGVNPYFLLSWHYQRLGKFIVYTLSDNIECAYFEVVRTLL